MKQVNSSLTCNVATHSLRVDGHPIGSEQLLEERLRAFGELEAMGIQETEGTLYDDFTKTVAFENGRYCVRLPWKEFH